jgi:hypothetical protein
MAEEFDTRYYRGVIVKIVDTNNVRVDILALGNIWLKNQRLRLHEVICPKWRSDVPEVKEAADLCMKEIKKHIAQGREYVFKIYGRDRMTCEIYVDGKNLCQHLLDNGYALHHFVKDF